jgi:predicted outer membrane repeat protein
VVYSENGALYESFSDSFSKNSARNSGGVILFTRSSFKIEKSKFTFNYGKEDSVLTIILVSSFFIKNSLF